MLKTIALAIALCFSFITPTQAVEKGAKPPAFTLPVLRNASQKKLSLHNFKGKVVYLDFWASWCGPCRQSLPILNDIRAKFKRKGFEVIAVNIDENRRDAEGFLAKYPVDYPILFDPKSTTPEKYDIKGMPTAYIIDKRGIVRHKHEGFRKKDAGDIEFMIQRYLAEK